MAAIGSGVERAVLTDGSVELTAGKCIFTYKRLKPGVLLITIVGDDRGQFGAAALDEVANEIDRFREPLALYFDLRRASGPSTSVMEAWTAWLAAHAHELRRVTALVPPESRMLHLTVSIAQHLSRTGNLLRICGERPEFERAVGEEIPGFRGLDD